MSGDGGLLLTSFKVDNCSRGAAASMDGRAESSDPGWTLNKEKEGPEQGGGRGGRSCRRSDGLPAVPEEASCGVAAVSLERRSRRSKVGRLLDAQQAADAAQNLQAQELALTNQKPSPRRARLCPYGVSVAGGRNFLLTAAGVLAVQDIRQPGQRGSASDLAYSQLALAAKRSRPHVGGGAQEGGDAVVGRRQRVGRARLAVVPVHVSGHVRQVHVQLIHGQQGHLDTQVNGKQLFLAVWAELAKRSPCEDRDWLPT